MIDEAALTAQKELGLELGMSEIMKKPAFLNEEQWTAVLKRRDSLRL